MPNTKPNFQIYLFSWRNVEGVETLSGRMSHLPHFYKLPKNVDICKHGDF